MADAPRERLPLGIHAGDKLNMPGLLAVIVKIFTAEKSQGWPRQGRTRAVRTTESSEEGSSSSPSDSDSSDSE